MQPAIRIRLLKMIGGVPGTLKFQEGVESAENHIRPRSEYMLVMSLLRRGSARTFLLIRLRPSRDSWAIQGGLPVWFFGATSTKLSTYAISLLSSAMNQQLSMEPL